MCGVSAIISQSPDALQENIETMVSVLTHRGPDGSGTFVERVSDSSYLALGHNRLSIIDLTTNAAQPMKSTDGRYVLIYNGEVYNYRELAEELGSNELLEGGYGDTAVVLCALMKWGPKALAKFNGMWALLLYDAQKKTLLVSRDRFGIKPLYYYRDSRRLLLASEVKALLIGGQARLSVNPDVAVPYLTRGLLDFSTDTFFNEVQQFPAASYAVVDLTCEPYRWPTIERFWHHPFELGERPEIGSVSLEQLKTVFLDAVALRLRSDVPVGVLLSGGIDSSAITGAIDEARALENLTILSVTSDDPDASEEPFIDVMAEWKGLVPRKVNVSRDPLALLAEVGEACWYNDGPVLAVSQIAHLRLMRIAQSMGIKVLLTGQGADEQLGGYNKFFYFWLRTLLGDHRYWAAAKMVAEFATHSNTLYEFRLSEAMRYIGRARLASHTFITPKHQHRDTIDLGLQGSYPRREWIDLVKTSVPALLHYEDRMSMSQSVEVRVPFLDFRLVECLARVHPSEKFEGGWTKSIFRKAIAGLVPREIQYRRDKKGFNVPEDRWMRDHFQPHVRELFAGDMMAEDFGLINSADLRSSYTRYVAGKGYLNGRHFFRAYAFEAFLRRFADYISTDSP